MQEKTDTTMSTEFIYGNRINHTYTDQGMIIRDALENLRKYGTCPNSSMPGNIEVPEAIRRFNQNALGVIPVAYPNRITNYCSLYKKNDMKLWLMTKGPIVFSVKWYENYWLTVNNELHFDEKSEPSGCHCMVIYGWNKEGWLFQNSWGNTWGDGGRAVYPYDATIREAWGVEDTCYSTYKDDLVMQLKDQINELNTALAAASLKVDNDQAQINELQARIQQLLETNAMTEEERAQLELDQARLVDALAQSKAEVEDYAKKLQDAQIQINLLNDTIIEIKKPYQNWPKWLVGVINFVLNLFRKNKKEVGK
jgi:chaperonin cofactor prefoldin